MTTDTDPLDALVEQVMERRLHDGCTDASCAEEAADLRQDIRAVLVEAQRQERITVLTQAMETASTRGVEVLKDRGRNVRRLVAEAMTTSATETEEPMTRSEA